MHKLHSNKPGRVVLATLFLMVSILVQAQVERETNQVQVEQQPVQAPEQNEKSDKAPRVQETEASSVPSPPPRDFKPSEKVYADTILTLPSDI